jgi:phytoene dehydrogenase-like protein
VAAALARGGIAAGVRTPPGEAVTDILGADGRASGVRTAGGRVVRARRAVIADVTAPALYRRLLAGVRLPPRLLEDLDRFEWDLPTVKVNWALSGKVPWRAAGASGAGTVHVGADSDGLIRWTADLGTGVVPQRPFLLVGQMTTADPTRSAAGTESLWAYTHLPRGVTDDESAHRLVDRIEPVLEAHAPGFRDLIEHRDIQTPAALNARDANLSGGTINGGTAQLHQELVFRPIPGLGRPETVVPGLFLGSSSAHPGGGVHGACGWLAARSALAQAGALRAVRRRITTRLLDTLYRERPSAR